MKPASRKNYPAIAKFNDGDASDIYWGLYTMIARRDENGDVFVTTAGYTHPKFLYALNLIEGVCIRKRGVKLTINGFVWDGGWVNLKDVAPLPELKVISNL